MGKNTQKSAENMQRRSSALDALPAECNFSRRMLEGYERVRYPLPSIYVPADSRQARFSFNALHHSWATGPSRPYLTVHLSSLHTDGCSISASVQLARSRAPRSNSEVYPRVFLALGMSMPQRRLQSSYPRSSVSIIGLESQPGRPGNNVKYKLNPHPYSETRQSPSTE